FNVTEHPTVAWTSQQIVEAFAERDAPRYIIRDRDGVYGNEVALRIASLYMEEVLTAPQSPWQNPYVERLIGYTERLLQPFRDSQRRASQENAHFVFRLLPRIQDPFGAGQAMPVSPTGWRVPERSWRARNWVVCIIV